MNESKTKEIVKNLFSFKGRMGRKSFFLRFLSILIILVTVALLIGQQGVTWFIFSGVFIFLHACNTVRRLHDINKPGWHYWLSLIPIYNIYFAVVLFTRKGSVDTVGHRINQSNSNLNDIHYNKISNKNTYNNSKKESFDLDPFDAGALVLAIIFWTAVTTGLWFLMGGLI